MYANSEISEEGFDALRAAVNYARAHSNPNLKTDNILGYLKNIGFSDEISEEAIRYWADYVKINGIEHV